VNSDDRIQLAQVTPGGNDAIEALISRYAPGIYRLAYGITRSDTDAEEIVHEVFARLVDKNIGVEGHAAAETWVYTIAFSASLDKTRGKCRHAKTSLEELLPRYTADGHREGDRDYLLTDWSGMPERQILGGESRHVLEEAISRLPDVHRAMLVLRDVEELSNEEVAEIVGCTVSEVKRCLHQARMALREHLTQQLGRHAREGVRCPAQSTDRSSDGPSRSPAIN
jgi:RNA polymerase sigma-70 factor, ECF subfamily